MCEFTTIPIRLTGPSFWKFKDSYGKIARIIRVIMKEKINKGGLVLIFARYWRCDEPVVIIKV